MASNDKTVTKHSSSSAIADFIEKANVLTMIADSGNSGRLMFALDATASRQPTWDSACNLQGQMFDAAQRVGNLQVQLCFYRGYQEARFSQWFGDATQLHRSMQKVQCAGGLTQIKRVLRHALDEHQNKPVSALVFVGDCIEENPDLLCDLAGQLGIHRVPAFVFQEGYDPDAEPVFKEIARLSGGAWCRFDQNSAQELRDLLEAVAVFAAGGKKALQDFTAARPALVSMVKQLTTQ
jgi:hypothetical protein